MIGRTFTITSAPARDREKKIWMVASLYTWQTGRGVASDASPQTWPQEVSWVTLDPRFLWGEP